MRCVVLFAVLCVAVAGGADFDALLELKKGITSDPSGRLFRSWTTDDSADCPAAWYGVSCTAGRVSAIDLDGLALSGTVVWSAFTPLEMLRNLSLSNNNFTGSLSPEIGSLSSLSFLDLSRNSFAGPVPVELAEMRNLVYLNLSSNSFEGILPSGLGNLSQLKYFDLRCNNFAGDLDVILGRLQSVVHVDLSQNGFSGSMNSILNNAAVTGSLQYLNVSYNRLSGELSDDGLVPLFDNLEVFDASCNQLSGLVPSFNLIVSLKILRLRNNQFSGSLPGALFRESSMVLTELDLSCNQLQGPVKNIASATLKNLNLSRNELSGSLPAKIGSCAIVDLSTNRLSGDLSTIQKWGNYVEVIDLSSNSLAGTLLNETSQLLRLTSLKVFNNSLVGELPPVIGTYNELNVLDLSHNQLYGTISPNLFTSRLTDVNLSGNSFTGRIPFPTNGKAISLSSDVPLPSSQSLVSLDLSNNSFSGPLLQEISTMSGLKLLNIRMNNISGQIPRELGMLHHLLYLDLSNNLFEGSIPDDLPEGIVTFNVSFNDLSGVVPNSLMRFPDSSFHPGNARLIFPYEPPSNAPFTNKGTHGHRMRVAIMYALIVGSVSCVAVILVLIVVYNRLSNSRNRPQHTDHWKPPFSHLFGLHKSAEARPASISFSQDHLLSSRSSSLPIEHVEISTAARESEQAGIQLSSIKDAQLDHANISGSVSRDMKSPMSRLISSPHTSEHGHPSILDVHSPDRLAGDLHHFDHTILFTAEELSRAPAEIIGRSCHGTSYKATLDSGHILTVKWLREGFAKGKKDFAREAKKLGNIRHPNLVPLRGYYWGPKEHERLIVSDYIDASSLMAHLCEFESRNLQPLSLSQRLSIAVDIARCLNYLHNEKAIPHGNLKSTNILIQPFGMNALLTDYSLHRIMTPAGMAEQVLNAGALGYRPPEFASTSKPCPSLKSDVYAFGVILLEILTSKNAGEIVSGNPGVVDLTDWVKLLANENRSYECFDRVIAEAAGSEEPPKAMDDMLRVALRCIRSAAERPEIKTVFEDLSSVSL